jgi:hypothetical protein
MSMQQTSQKAATHQAPASGLLQRKCACGRHTGGGSECTDCRKKRERVLDRHMANGSEPSAIPPIVYDVLRSPGQPLDADTRAFFEPRFHADFSSVRIHTNDSARHSARSVNALAYTVGNNIVFDAGAYAPQRRAGQTLLAHELTHVVQQHGHGPLEAGSLSLQSPNAPAEQNAEQTATQIMSSPSRSVRVHGSPVAIQRQMCRSILDAEEAPAGERISASEAERRIRLDLLLQNPGRVTRFTIPGASAQHLRDESCGGTPQEPRGLGEPDLIHINGNQAEIAEVKIGIWPCLDLAERQVSNYVTVGNDAANAGWRASLGLANNAFQLMPTSRFTPSSIQTGENLTSVGWCEPGVIVYKTINRHAKDTFICSNLSDKGAVDRFLNRVMDPAQVMIEKYINQVVNEINKRIDAEMARVRIPALLVMDILATVKNKIVTMLREEVQTSLRQYLQQSLNILCATAGARGIVSLKEMLDRLDKQKDFVLVPALIAVAARLAKEATEAVLKALLVSVLIVAALAIAAYAIYLSKGRIIVAIPKIIEFLQQNPRSIDFLKGATTLSPAPG